MRDRRRVDRIRSAGNLGRAVEARTRASHKRVERLAMLALGALLQVVTPDADAPSTSLFDGEGVDDEVDDRYFRGDASIAHLRRELFASNAIEM